MKRYRHPTVFRIDRIRSYEILEQKFKIPHKDRFEEGEFRKRVQFMYPGKLMRVRFLYSGKSPEAVLDRLPTARVLRKLENACEFEAEIFGTGIIMWFLSQGDAVEVLAPKSMREEIAEKIKEMGRKYEE